MSNEHIGRIKQFGLGKQSAANTPVNPTMWLPCESLEFNHVFEKIRDDAAYGLVDEFSGEENISIKKAEVNGECKMRDISVGHLLKAAFGTEYLVSLITITGASGGTPARGDVITSSAGSWAGVIRKVIVVGAVTYYAVSTTSGTIGDIDAVTDLTNGTWTGGTVEQGDFAAAKGHYFVRTNDNSTHPMYSLYTEDPVAGRETSDALLDSLDIEVMPDAYPKINFAFKGINVVDGGSLTPANTNENLFLAKHASVKFAADEASLTAANAVALRRFKLSIAKNLFEEMACGQDGAVSGFFPQQFGVTGDLEALFNSETLRNYHLDNSFKACRLAFLNTAATPLVDLAADIVPSLYIDLYKSYFSDWGQSNDLNGITSQTLGYIAHNDRQSTGMTVDCLLLNTRDTIY